MFQREAIGLADARRAVDAMLEAGARNYPGPIAIAILDENAQYVAFARMDGCTFHNNHFAFKKAYTAVFHGQNSGAVAKQMADRGRHAADFGDDNILFLSGGVVIKRPGAKTVLGGIGVSGLSGEEDEEIALIGLKALGLS